MKVIEEIIVKIILFIIVSIIGGLISYLFAALIPGGDADTNQILISSMIIIGEIAICTNIIIDKLDKSKKTRD